MRKISTIELVFTRCTRRKFNKDNNSSYNFSGGLHGVGVSVTNALSIGWKQRFSWRLPMENCF